jgi:NAD-dependent SIR2 family protein deacetylase
VQWAKGPHGKAELSLTTGQLESTKCSTCHTTLGVTASLEKLKGVQCESCHGPGQYYHPAYVMKDKELAAAVGLVRPTSVDCERCHTAGAPSIRQFDFAKFWAEIDHGAAARVAWEKKNAKSE